MKLVVVDPGGKTEFSETTSIDKIALQSVEIAARKS
jgi:hypothetical protein